MLKSACSAEKENLTPQSKKNKIILHITSVRTKQKMIFWHTNCDVKEINQIKLQGITG